MLKLGKRNVSLVKVRFYSAWKPYRISEAKYKKIHVAINLLFPGLGDKSVHQLTNEFRNSKLTNGNGEQSIKVETEKPSPIDHKGLLEEMDFVFPFTTRSFIDETFLFETEIEHELNENHNEIYFLPKLRKNVKVNPLIFCGDYNQILDLYQSIYSAQCENEQEIVDFLTSLKEVGKDSFKMHLSKYNIKVENIPFEKIVSCSFIPKAISPDLRSYLHYSQPQYYENTFYQYLGFATLINGDLSRRFIKSFSKNDTPSLPCSDKRPKDLKLLDFVSKKELSYIRQNLYHHLKFGEYSLQTLIQRNFLLDQEQEHKHKWKGINNNLITTFFGEKVRLGILGYKILQDFKLETNPLLDMFKLKSNNIKYTNQPNFAKFDLENLSTLVNSERVTFPPIINFKSEDLYEMPKIVINNNVINRILISSISKMKNKWVQRFLNFFAESSSLAYIYYLKRSIMQHTFEDYTKNTKDEVIDVLTDSLFKEYYLNKHLQSKIRENYSIDIYDIKFNQIFGCLSEESKYKFCDTVICRVFQVLDHLKDDYRLVNIFFKELKLQLKKNQEALTPVLEQYYETTQPETRKVNSTPSSVSEESLRELALKYLKFENSRLNVDCSLRTFIFLSTSFDEKVKLLFHDEKLIEMGQALLTNQKIEPVNILKSSEKSQEVDLEKLDIALCKVKVSLTNKKSDIPMPSFSFDSANKKLLAICYYVSLNFYKKLGIKKYELPEVIAKQANVAFEFYQFQVFKQILLHSKLAQSSNEKILFFLTKEKKLFKLINEINGFDYPQFGDRKLTQEYRDLIDKKIVNEFYDLKYQIQIFNQFLAILMIDDEAKLVLWIEQLVKKVLKQTEHNKDVFLDMKSLLNLD